MVKHYTSKRKVRNEIIKVCVIIDNIPEKLTGN